MGCYYFGVNVHMECLLSVKDVVASLLRINLVGLLGWHDIKQRYKRSLLGPFWITISMGVFVAAIGLLFGQILKVPMEEFLPFLAIGLIVWNFCLAVMTEGSEGFISAESVIRQLPVPLFVHLLRVICRNLIIFLHNLLIIPVIFLYFDVPVTSSILLVIPGMVLLLVNLAWFTLIFGVFCTRFRDLSQVLRSILQVVFYLTPIMWMPSLIEGRSSVYILNLNPFYYFIEIIRGPILGNPANLNDWLICAFIGIVGWVAAIFIYSKYKDRIAYWL